MTTPDPIAEQPLPDDRQRAAYLLLGRLKHDCEHYLGHGGRNPRRLWALDEAEQIAKMKELHAVLTVKPEWLSIEAIQSFEAQMLPPA